jgi:hypothetical protein
MRVPSHIGPFRSTALLPILLPPFLKLLLDYATSYNVLRQQ